MHPPRRSGALLSGAGQTGSMQQIATRAMTSAEFGSLRPRLIREYAAKHVEAGNWTSEMAEVRAAEQTDELLPQGVSTPGVLMLMGESPEGDTFGFFWLALERQPGAGDGAWIYYIEVWSEFRGRGFGRALLAAAEIEAATHGAHSVGLNVFGGNTVARNLYESMGYGVSTMHLEKELPQKA